jgi:DNA-binding MarR family transcriptional regulator
LPLRDELLLSREPGPGLALLLSVSLTRELLGQFEEERFFRDADLTSPQFNVLRILRGGPRQGYPLTEIRRRLISRNADVVRLVDRLVARGLVARVDNPADGRSSLVQVTDPGRRLLASLEAPLARMESRLDRLLPQRDRERLLALLDRVREGLRTDLGPSEGEGRRRTSRRTP